MSARYAGTLTSIASAEWGSGTAPKRILMRHCMIWSRLISSPSRAFASSTAIRRVTGLRSGVVHPVSGVCICTDSIFPPRSASAVVTMFNATDTDLSVPVTSMNRSSVSSLTRVSVPLMIGGNDSTLPRESRIRGYLSNFSTRCANLTPFGCSVRISSIDIGTSKSRGTNSKVGSAAMYSNGGVTRSRS